MDIFTDYEIPYFHPLLVHYPIALFTAAIIVCALWLFSSSGRWFIAYLSMQVLGTIGALAAYFTGEGIRDDTEDVPIVDLLVDRHEQWGKYTLILACVISVVSLAIAYFYRKRSNYDGIPVGARIAVSILALLLVLLTAYTAHLGGVMVWGIPTS